MLLVVLAGCNKYPNGTPRDGITKVCDYLYETTMDTYEPTAAYALMTDENFDYAAACSAVRNGKYFGRNFDWYYDKSVEFIMHVPAAEGRFASVGVVGGLPMMKAKLVESGKDSEYYAMLPYLTVDGINENGVTVSMNVVPNDFPNTNIKGNGGPTITTLMVPRYILDNARSARHAVELIQDANIVYSAVGKMEFHYMIADENETYIVEFFGDSIAYTDELKIMTNYFVTIDTLTAHAMGMERYDILKAGYAQANTLDGMRDLMQSVKYSQMYDRSVDPFWYSEYNGDWREYGYPDLTIRSPHSEYEKVIKDGIRRRKLNARKLIYDIWHTQHETIYDIENKTLEIYVQEDFVHKYSFSL